MEVIFDEKNKNFENTNLFLIFIINKKLKTHCFVFTKAYKPY